MVSIVIQVLAPVPSSNFPQQQRNFVQPNEIFVNRHHFGGVTKRARIEMGGGNERKNNKRGKDGLERNRYAEVKKNGGFTRVLQQDGVKRL